MTPRNRRARSIGLVFIATLGAMAALTAAWNAAVNTWLSLSRPAYAMTYTGGLVAALAERPELWYQPLSNPPYVTTIYPPGALALYHGIYAAAGGILPMPVIVRGVGELSVVATGVVIALAANHIVERKAVAALSGLLYVLSPAVMRATTYGRIDNLAVLAAACALYWYLSRDGAAQVVGVAAFTMAALWTKHSLIAVPLALTLAYGVKPDYRKMFGYVGIVGGVGGLAFVGLLFWTHGQAWIHLVTYNATQPIVLSQLVEQLSHTMYHHLVIIAAGAVISTRYADDWNIPPVLVIWLALTAAGTIATIGKVGAWVGYAYPFLVGGCIAVGVLVDGLLPERLTEDNVTDASVLLVALLLAVQFGIYAGWGPTTVVEPEHQQQAAAYVQQADGPVLSEDASLVDEDGELVEPLMLKYLARDGAWNQRPLVERIRRGEYTLIVTWTAMDAKRAWDGTRWTRTQVEAIRDRYELVERCGKYRVYKPA